MVPLCKEEPFSLKKRFENGLDSQLMPSLLRTKTVPLRSQNLRSRSDSSFFSECMKHDYMEYRGRNDLGHLWLCYNYKENAKTWGTCIWLLTFPFYVGLYSKNLGRKSTCPRYAFSMGTGESQQNKILDFTLPTFVTTELSRPRNICDKSWKCQIKNFVLPGHPNGHFCI